MPTEERDIQIEDQVDFTSDQSIEQEELTPEVTDFEETDTEEETSEMPVDSIETTEPQQMDQTDTFSQSHSLQEPIASEIPSEPTHVKPVQQSQETSSSGRVMRFEDFVNKRD